MTNIPSLDTRLITDLLKEIGELVPIAKTTIKGESAVCIEVEGKMKMTYFLSLSKIMIVISILYIKVSKIGQPELSIKLDNISGFLYYGIIFVSSLLVMLFSDIPRLLFTILIPAQLLFFSLVIYLTNKYVKFIIKESYQKVLLRYHFLTNKNN